MLHIHISELELTLFQFLLLLFNMVHCYVVFQVARLLFTVWTFLFHKSCSQMHLGNVQFQIEFAVGCIIALVTHLVPRSSVNPLHVNQHSPSLTECLVTLRTRHFDPLNPLLPTQCSFKVTLHVLENFSAKDARFLQSLCVHSVKVPVQASFGGRFVVTFGTQELLRYFMSPFNMDPTSKICAIVFSAIVTRHPF